MNELLTLLRDAVAALSELETAKAHADTKLGELHAALQERQSAPPEVINA